VAEHYKPMISVGPGAPKPRDDIAPPKASPMKAKFDSGSKSSGSPAEQRMAERRRRGVNHAGPAFRRSS